MKRVIMLLTLAVVFLLGACSSTEPENLTEADGQLAEQVGLFVTSYKETMIEAVNTGDFNELEQYLIANTSFYHSLRHYVDELSIANTTKELLSMEVGAVYVDDIDGIYVDASEKVVLHEENNDREIERDIQYQLVRHGDESFRIVNIKEIK